MSLTVQNLCFSYGEKEILQDISFSFHSGQVVCLLGSNGAGKSTLFRCMLQFLTEYRGNVLWNGVDLRGETIENRAKKIAYVPQSHRPVFNYTVEEVVLMGTTSSQNWYQQPKEKERIRANNAMQTVHISHLAQRGYRDLSGGERQLVLIARALAQEAEVLLMDEPTSSLDFGNQVRILEICKELANQGYLILQSTHQPDHALLFADQVLVLHGGGIFAQGKPAEVLTDSLLSTIYHVDVSVFPLPKNSGYTCVPKIFVK